MDHDACHIGRAKLRGLWICCGRKQAGEWRAVQGKQGSRIMGARQMRAGGNVALGRDVIAWPGRGQQQETRGEQEAA